MRHYLKTDTVCYNNIMEEIEYKGLIIKATKLDNGCYKLECDELNTENGKKILYCDDKSERFLEKIYLMVKNPGTFVG